MNILLLYIGEPRLVKSSINNHILFFERLARHCNTNINLTLQYSTLSMLDSDMEFVISVCQQKGVNVIFEFITNSNRLDIAKTIVDNVYSHTNYALSAIDVLNTYFQIISRSIAINNVKANYDRIIIFRTDVLIKNQFDDIIDIDTAIYTDNKTLYPSSNFNNNQEAILINEPWWCLGITENRSSDSVKSNSIYGIWVDDRISMSNTDIFKKTFGFDIVNNITHNILDKINLNVTSELKPYILSNISNHNLNLEYLNNSYFKQHLIEQNKLLVFPVQKKFITELVTIRNELDHIVFDEVDSEKLKEVWTVYTKYPYGQAQNLTDVDA